MRWKKILLILALFIVALLVTVCVILATYDFNKFKPRIIQAVRETTGRELILGGDIKFELGLAPGLSVENVSFQNADWGSQADVARVKRFEVQVAILPLIWGDIQIKHFILVEPDILLETNPAGDINVEFPTSKKQQTPAAKKPGLIVNEVQIINGRLTYKDGVSNDSYALRIDRFSAFAASMKDPVTVDFRGAFNKKSFEIHATLEPLFNAIRTAEPLSIDLTAKTKDTTVNIEGLVRDPVAGKGLDCKLTAAGSSILNITDFTGASGMPDIGPYQLVARVTGSTDRLTVNEVDFSAGSESRLQATVSGSIEDLFNLQDIELGFQFWGNDVAHLETLFDQPLPLAGAFALSGRFNNRTADVYRFNSLIADLGHNQITGSMVFDLSGQRPKFSAALTSQKLDLGPLSFPANFDISGAKSITDWGPFKLVLNTAGTLKHLSVEKLDFQAGNENLAELSLQGSVNNLMSLQGIGVYFVIQGENIANLAKLFNRTAPITGGFKATGKFVDSAEKTYRFNKLNIHIPDSDISGFVQMGFAGKRPQIDASLVSTIVNLKSIITNHNQGAATAIHSAGSAITPETPSPGRQFPLDILKALDANIKVQTGQLLLPDLTVNRMAMDILLKDGQLTASARGPALPDISQLTGVKGLTRLGPYNISATAKEIDGNLSIEDLNILAGKPDTAQISIHAAVSDLITLSGVKGRFTIRGNDIVNLEPLVGQPLPFDGVFSAAGNLNMPEIHVYRLHDVEILAGQNDVNGRVDINLTGNRPRIKGEWTSRKLDLRWLYSNTGPTDTSSMSSTETGEKNKKIFPDDPLPTGMLKVADLDLKIRGDEIRLPRITMRELRATIILDDGHLRARPFNFSAGDGSVQGGIDLRAEGDVLALEAEIDIDQVFLYPAIEDMDVSRTLEGTIDAKIKISGRGNSIAGLMAGLDGKIIYAHRGGQIANKYLSLLFGDLTTELVKRINIFSQKETYTEINCFIGHLAINKGLAEQAFLLDTPQSTLSAAGNINLKTETLKLGFKTSPKKGVKVPGLGRVSLSLGELTKPFNIGGTLSKPALIVDPTKTAVTFGKVMGGLALGPAGLAVVFGEVSKEDVDPCLKALKAAKEPAVLIDPAKKKKVKKKRWWQK
jgi:uncharacterized protein involved in outer membrane biogenesis